MLRERLAVTLLLLPLALWVIADGSWLYLAAIGLVLALAAAEFALLFRRHGFRPATGLIVGGTVLLTISRFFSGFDQAPALLTALFLVAMTWHLVDFERGAPRSGTDLAITLAGILYLGWIGAFLISLRRMPDGEWWLLLALPSVWLADTAAYFVGRAVGKRRLSPRLSPKKTWEGYLAGLVGGALTGLLFAPLWQMGAGPASGVSPASGLLLGVIIGALAPLGDLGESMIKREIGVKDSGTLLPGHGGALDRLDSWLWAGVLGFYLASWLAG